MNESTPQREKVSASSASAALPENGRRSISGASSFGMNTASNTGDASFVRKSSAPDARNTFIAMSMAAMQGSTFFSVGRLCDAPRTKAS